MSSKQKSPKKPKSVRDAGGQVQPFSASQTLKNVGRAAALLLLAGVASPISQLNLSPVYGSIPSSQHHQRAMTFTSVAALIGRNTIKRQVPANIADWIAVIAYWTPVVQFLLFPYSKALGLDYGPLVIEGLTYFPLLFASIYAAGELLDCIDPTQFNLPSSLREMVIPMASYFTVSTTAKIASSLLPSMIGTHILHTRTGLQMVVASISAILSPSAIVLAAFPAILHTLWANPHYSNDHALGIANSTLYASTNFTLLARHESITGYISVLENDDEASFRLLRCDHSLLGGEWLVTPAAYAKGQRSREPIFAVFVLLEAVRLMEPLALDSPPVPETSKSALNIGLGVGTAPNALISHGINTTIVEVDPVVHHYATQFFGLDPNHTAIIADAVSYVAETSITNPSSFDYIIHDVFTGGAEPVALFTKEFFDGLRALLAPGGVVAINYAGDLSLGSTRLVLNTIHAVFPACRLFRDTPPPPTWAAGDPDFINMVVFCVGDDVTAAATAAGGKAKDAIRFRPATEEDDFRGSLARRQFLAPRPELEIAYTYVPEEAGGKVMRAGGEGVAELEKWHKGSAASHWGIMRSVLLDDVWQIW